MSTLTLPRGAFINTATPHRGPLCLAAESYSYCFRPQHHGGRHAHVGASGKVFRVWGEDVHAETRARGKAELVKKANQRLERVVDLIGFGVDPEDAWGAVEKVAAAHRPPCIDGSVCAESAHCPPEDGAR